MKFMILLHSNPHFAQRWEALTPEQRSRFGVDHLALTRELAGSGELVAAEGLADPAVAWWVSTAGRPDEAVTAYREAARRTSSAPERAYLLDRASRVRAAE